MGFARLSCVERVKSMKLEAVSRIEPKRNNNRTLGASAAVGALAGAASRYVIPTKKELASADAFLSTAAMSARGAKRSILKFGAAGAVIASALALIAKAFKGHKPDESVEYTKLGALVDAPDYACEIMWYGE